MEHISRHPKHSHWNYYTFTDIILRQCGESVLATDTEIDTRMEQGSNCQPLWLLDHLFYPIDFSYPTSTPLLTTSAHTLTVVSNISYLSVLTRLHTTVLKVLSTKPSTLGLLSMLSYLSMLLNLVHCAWNKYELLPSHLSPNLSMSRLFKIGLVSEASSHPEFLISFHPDK